MDIQHTGNAKLAVLIDADNAQAGIFEEILSEIADFGEAIVKRIYGDFTNTHSSQWKGILNRFAIRPMQQFAYTTGKNSTDSALIIDAMDLLHSGHFDGFCLISSDSDFTGLALRIREQGLMVYGFGEQKTPEAFRNACHKFIFTEVLRKDTRKRPSPDPRRQSRGRTPSDSPGMASTVFPEELIREAIEKYSEDSGWAQLGVVGTYISKVKPDFDARLYGAQNSKLSTLMKMKPDLIQMRESSGAVYIRVRPTQTPERTEPPKPASISIPVPVPPPVPVQKPVEPVPVPSPVQKPSEPPKPVEKSEKPAAEPKKRVTRTPRKTTAAKPAAKKSETAKKPAVRRKTASAKKTAVPEKQE